MLFFTKKYSFLIMALLVFFVASVITAYGDTICVSISNGDNKNPGTKESPMKNLDKAIAKA
jgi:hypothetical protein